MVKTTESCGTLKTSGIVAFCGREFILSNTALIFPPCFALQYVPPDLCICNFVLEQSLSVRALQEMLANTGDNSSEGVSKLFSSWHHRMPVVEKQTVSDLGTFKTEDVQN